jgi:hypothetical protein
VQLLISFMSCRFLCALINWCVRLCVGSCNHKEPTCHQVLKTIIQHLAFTVFYSGQSIYREILDKLIVAQLVWEFPASVQKPAVRYRVYSSPPDNNVVSHLSPSTVTAKCVVMLSTHLCLNLSGGLVIWVSHSKRWIHFVSFSICCMSYPSHNLLDGTNMTLVVTSILPLSCDATQYRYQMPAVSILWQCLVSVPEEHCVVILFVVRFIWLMLRASGELLFTWKLTLGLHEKWGVSPLEKNLPNF